VVRDLGIMQEVLVSIFCSIANKKNIFNPKIFKIKIYKGKIGRKKDKL
jgi:hypothetical protein